MSKFVPGRSGNPSGRPKGIKNRLSVLRESLVTPGEAREVVAKLVESARGGDTQAAGILLDRIWPKLRPTSPAIALALPEGDLAEQAEAVVRELAAGNLPAADASHILGSLSAVAKIKEVTEFERRLEALEKRHLFKRGE
ncbi:DUF5681 domain-containing protein [Arenimonas daejeonensis]|uniref:DUF5681 domain-containing protein n=1 Tax=Arenimonas daejeonensis TaxID=370777 RepID=UPI0011BDB42B|nr:DUF5681 domain-containing protein [Arenimonas daejeonensis]